MAKRMSTRSGTLDRGHPGSGHIPTVSTHNAMDGMLSTQRLSVQSFLETEAKEVVVEDS